MEFEGKLSSAEGQRELKREQVIERAVAEDWMEKAEREGEEERRGSVEGGAKSERRLQKVTGTLFFPINISPFVFCQASVLGMRHERGWRGAASIFTWTKEQEVRPRHKGN